MMKHRKIGGHSEKGIALLIAIFVLLLISVVAISLLVSSGTETALGANYRSSSTVYYAALAGLEEARGRLVPKNPNYFGASTISPTAEFPLHQAIYVINRGPGDNIVPWDSSNAFYDQEYQNEFGQPASSAGVDGVYSVWDNNVQGIPGPIYKWVRITAATEQSLYLDVNSGGGFDPNTLIYYDPAQVDSHGNPAPTLIKKTASLPSTAVQALQITAMAELPNGSKKILQYVVAPVGVTLTLPAALTLDGINITNPNFSVPDSSSFGIQGFDENPSPPSSGGPPAPQALPPSGCTPSPTPVPAIGYIHTGDNAVINSNLGYVSNYAGFGGTPSVNNVNASLPPSLQKVGALNNLVSTITQGADVVLTGPVTQSDGSNLMPAWMSPSAPAVVVVNGDMTFSGWHGAGYGILLVTGTFTYDPVASWNGIVMVIGQGTIISNATQAGTGQFNGGMLLARTLDGSGNPLSPSSLPNAPYFNFNFGGGGVPDNGGLGIYYSSCWIQYVQTPTTYKVLSFHEIPQ